MSAAAAMRRGACPGVSTPMPTGDGLLARLMPIGTIGLDAMAGLCAAARRHGNGIVEITSRGSLQIRGLSDASAPAFADAAAQLDIAAQHSVPVITDPLSGLDPKEMIDAEALATELRQQLVTCGLVPRVHAFACNKNGMDDRDIAEPSGAVPMPGHDNRKALSPKVSVAIDGGGALHLDALAADVRLQAVAAPTGPRLHVAIGGDSATAVSCGTLAVTEAVDTVVGLMREIAARGPDARGHDLVCDIRKDAPLRAPREHADPIGRHRLRHGKVAIGLGFPVGHTHAGTLEGLLRVAREAGATGVRTAPGRALLMIGMTANNAVEFTAAAKRSGFITEPRDPGRRIVACAGAPMCGSGEIEARALAAAIARGASLLLDRDETIHISGCAKCCAHQRVAALTAIGRDGRCDLFVEGAPAGSCLPEQLEERLAQLAVQRMRDRHG